ncbi:lymphocyte function-associated antigen 3-like isoform X1 [Arapaima gigas]
MCASQWILFLTLLWTFHSRDLFKVSAESKLDVISTCNQKTCILSCKSDSCSAYSWKENGKVKEMGNSLILEKSENKGNIYTCACNSSVGEEESDPILDSELFPEGELKVWILAAVIVPVAIAVVLLGALAYHCFVRRIIKGTNTNIACGTINKLSGNHQFSSTTETDRNVVSGYMPENSIPNHDYCVVKA